MLILDHIILTKQGYFSFGDDGLLLPFLNHVWLYVEECIH
ncbi:MAG: hypothetical protein ACTIJ2_13985 [Sphingobacteriaceae bacterium]